MPNPEPQIVRSPTGATINPSFPPRYAPQTPVQPAVKPDTTTERANGKAFASREFGSLMDNTPAVSKGIWEGFVENGGTAIYMLRKVRDWAVENPVKAMVGGGAGATVLAASLLWPPATLAVTGVATVIGGASLVRSIWNGGKALLQASNAKDAKANETAYYQFGRAISDGTLAVFSLIPAAPGALVAYGNLAKGISGAMSPVFSTLTVIGGMAPFYRNKAISAGSVSEPEPTGTLESATNLIEKRIEAREDSTRRAIELSVSPKFLDAAMTVLSRHGTEAAELSTARNKFRDLAMSFVQELPDGSKRATRLASIAEIPSEPSQQQDQLYRDIVRRFYSNRNQELLLVNKTPLSIIEVGERVNETMIQLRRNSSGQ